MRVQLPPMRFLLFTAVAACATPAGQSLDLKLSGPALVRVDRLGAVDGPDVVLSDGSVPDALRLEAAPSAVATVEQGQVHARSSGEATVTAHWQGQQVTWKLVVSPSEYLSLQDPPLGIPVGDRLELLVVNQHQARVGGEHLDWSTSAPEIATVEDGWVTGHATGVVFVTARGSGSQLVVELDIE